MAEPLEVEEDSDAEGEDRADTERPPEIDDELPEISDEPSKKLKKKSAKKSQKATTPRKLWTADEHAAVKRQLDRYFYLEKLPGKHEIEEARKREPLLLNRPWMQIKSFIKNTKLSMKRKQNKATK